MNLIEALRKSDKVRRPSWRAGIYLKLNSVLAMVMPEWDKPQKVSLLRSDVMAEDWEEAHAETRQP